MPILLFFAFVSGLLTIFAPCIWPILPVVLSSASTGGRRKPIGITLGLMLSFFIATLTISYLVKIIPFDPTILRLFSVLVITVLGFALIIPALSTQLESFTSRLINNFLPKTTFKDGFGGGFTTGLALGLVWTPCAGPILATIAALSATRSVNAQVVLMTLSYVLGVGIPLFILALFGNWLFVKSRLLSKYTQIVQQIFGVVMILTALAIYTNFDRTLQVKLLNYFPQYSNILTKIESQPEVREQLDLIKSQQVKLDTLGDAPEFSGISKWLNSQPLTMSELKGKVVLIDFWTYTCINCIRTLPHVGEWYNKYKDQGLVIVGVHTPEFEFEKITQNVEKAIEQYGIKYPVAQDNDYSTWRAYQNQYWPAHYLIDAQGKIRYTHFGEGNYEETENAIRNLLLEAGKQITVPMPESDSLNMRFLQTPETYLGTARAKRIYEKLDGDWVITPEYIESVPNTSLTLNFTADKVFLVITPVKSESISVYLDDILIDSDQAGSDVVEGRIQIDTARLYEIVDLKGKPGSHKLRLDFKDGGSQLFAFTFG